MRIVLGLMFMFLVGVFQALPYGLVFLGRVLKMPLTQENAEVERMVQTRIADIEQERDILLGPGFVFSDSLIVSGGAVFGTQKDDLVVSPDGIVVGVVTEVGAEWSKAALFSRLGNTVVLRAGNEKEIVFEAHGIGGGELRAELPSAVALRTGDTLWLGIRPMYVAGLVDTIDRAPGRQLQQLIIRVPIVPERLRRVLILHSVSDSL